MQCNIENHSEFMKKSIEFIKQKCKEAGMSNELSLKIGAEIIKDMKLPLDQEEYLLKRNIEWFSGDSENTKNNIKDKDTTISFDERISCLERKLCKTVSEIQENFNTIEFAIDKILKKIGILNSD